jgi:hypothetical protein
MKLNGLAIAGCLLLTLMSGSAHAQLLGHNYPGDNGLMSGSQAPPGWMLTTMYLRYEGDTLRGNDGESIAIDPEERGSLDVNSFAIGFNGVTKFKVLGANYGFMVFPALTNNVFEAPILALTEKVDTGFSDLYVQPINLGWHTERADFLAGLGVYAPTGRYEAGADDNLGMGMWSFEIYGGTTVFLDKAKSWHFAATAFYETHTEKKDTDIKVGDILTLEGGVGGSFMQGAANAGMAYWAQWKVTDDEPGSELQPVFDALQLDRHRGYGFGPEITLPIKTKKKLIALVNARYLWETGVRNQLEGSHFTLAVTFPIPSTKLQ